MPLPFALLLSLIVHIALIAAPTWPPTKQRPLPMSGIDARLLPLPAPEAMAEAVSSDAIPDQLAALPRNLRGAPLRRAQAALSKHLFYPPQAIALGLEGEVILLLSLTESGELVSATIARGSGHAMLDQAALDAARNIGALPGSPRQTLFPVSFRLR